MSRGVTLPIAFALVMLAYGMGLAARHVVRRAPTAVLAQLRTADPPATAPDPSFAVAATDPLPALRQPHARPRSHRRRSGAVRVARPTRPVATAPPMPPAAKRAPARALPSVPSRAVVRAPARPRPAPARPQTAPRPRPAPTPAPPSGGSAAGSGSFDFSGQP